jgi:hypothetical protein
LVQIPRNVGLRDDGTENFLSTKKCNKVFELSVGRNEAQMGTIDRKNTHSIAKMKGRIDWMHTWTVFKPAALNFNKRSRHWAGWTLK